MNLRQLEAFRATIRTGSVSKAAELLCISQPSVSRLIGDLERSVGFDLFTRTGRGLSATVEARRFEQAVESMFIGIDRLAETARIIRTTLGGEVALGVIPPLIQTVMPEVVQKVHAGHDDLRVSVSVRNTPAIVDAVLMQQLDLGLVSPSYYQFEGVQVLKEFTLPYMCLIPETHPLADCDEPVDLNELQGKTLVSLARSYLDLLGLDPALADRIADTRISTHSMPAVAAIARVTGSPALVDPFSARAAISQGGVVARPIRQNIQYRLSIITRGNETLSIAGRTLADAVADEIETRYVAAPG